MQIKKWSDTDQIDLDEFVAYGLTMSYSLFHSLSPLCDLWSIKSRSRELRPFCLVKAKIRRELLNLVDLSRETCVQNGSFRVNQ